MSPLKCYKNAFFSHIIGTNHFDKNMNKPVQREVPETLGDPNHVMHDHLQKKFEVQPGQMKVRNFIYTKYKCFVLWLRIPP